MVPLYLVVFLNMAALGVVIPLLPFYATHFGASDGAAPLVFSTFSAATLLTAPLWGRWSDQIGRRPILIVSTIGTVAAYIWLGLAESLWEVFVSRALAGAMSGWLPAAMAYVADSTQESDRARGMGMIGASVGSGFVLGPALGGYFVGGDAPNYMLPSIAAASFSVGGLVLLLAGVKEPSRHTAPMEPAAAWTLLKDGLIARLFIIYFGVYLVFTALEGTFPLWGRAALSIGPREVSYWMVFIGVIMIVVQGGLIRRLAARFGEAQLMCFGIFMIAIGLAGLPFVSSVWVALLPTGCIAAGVGLFNPSMQSLVSRAAPRHLQGSALGSAQSVVNCARILGPAWGGMVFGTLGIGWPYHIGALALIPVVLITVPLVLRLKTAAS